MNLLNKTPRYFVLVFFGVKYQMSKFEGVLVFVLEEGEFGDLFPQ